MQVARNAVDGVAGTKEWVPGNREGQVMVVVACAWWLEGVRELGVTQMGHRLSIYILTFVMWA
jgi:hypothetical protein